MNFNKDSHSLTVGNRNFIFLKQKKKKKHRTTNILNELSFTQLKMNNYGLGKNIL